jgi:hypothetical protein
VSKCEESSLLAFAQCIFIGHNGYTDSTRKFTFSPFIRHRRLCLRFKSYMMKGTF